MRTKKPLDLFLAPPMWKLVAGMKLTVEDLEEVRIFRIREIGTQNACSLMEDTRINYRLINIHSY